MKQFLSGFAMVATLASATLQAADLQLLWEAEGFKMPESVVYDPIRGQYYVSNVNGAPLSEDHNGSVGVIDAQSQQSTVEWVTGLSSPKGLALHGKYLYIADVKELVVVDVELAQVSARYPAPNANVLNGVVVKDDQVFVSDWMGNAIYQLAPHGLEPWLISAELDSPNGLAINGEFLYVGAWGNETQADFTTKTTGGLKRVSLTNKAIETLSRGDEWMNLDGLHAVSANRILATDFIQGELLTLNKKGIIKQRVKLASPSSADFYFNERHDVVVVPYLMTGKVAAYRLK